MKVKQKFFVMVLMFVLCMMTFDPQNPTTVFVGGKINIYGKVFRGTPGAGDTYTGRKSSAWRSFLVTTPMDTSVAWPLTRLIPISFRKGLFACLECRSAILG